MKTVAQLIKDLRSGAQVDRLELADALEQLESLYGVVRVPFEETPLTLEEARYVIRDGL